VSSTLINLFQISRLQIQ